MNESSRISLAEIFNIQNILQNTSKYRLEIYVNYELKKTYIGELDANEVNEIVHEFDNISVGDYVFINVIPIEEERNKAITVIHIILSYQSKSTKLKKIHISNIWIL